MATLSTLPVRAEGNIEPTLQFSVSLSATEVVPGANVDLIIDVTNTGDIPSEAYTLLLYSTDELTLAQDKKPHDLYEPLLTRTLALSPGASERIIVPLHVLENAKASQGVALVHQQEENRHPGEMVARIEVPVSGAPALLAPQYDYNMPSPPEVSCGPSPPLSRIGDAVDAAIVGAYFSQHTGCNEFEGDWILDVPNVVSTTAATSAEDFYAMTADLIENTEYIFSMSSLLFSTHDETPREHNLIRHYLAPAVRKLHDNTPQDGLHPLLRFAYSPSKLEIVHSDPLIDVYNDLIAELPPDSDEWRVSIAIAEIGAIPTRPWNHSKIAVRDYRYAIVGGMNWDLNYVLPVDIDGDGIHTDTVEIDGHVFGVHRLHDLSVKVEGEAAKGAGVFFDLLWRRNIDPLFPHYGDDCISSWYWYDRRGGVHYDCPLDAVRDYAPDNRIPDYDVSSSRHVFSLGRGHTDWYLAPKDYKDLSADAAVLAAFDAAQDTIYISQHQLSLPIIGFTDVIVTATIQAVVDNYVRVKIALSEPWGLGFPPPDSLAEVYAYLEDELYDYATDTYPGPQEVYRALCRLEFGPFRGVPRYPFPETKDHLYHTHNKFFMVDEKAFYVGSQNLYPSAIGETALVPELNEYGFLVDDTALATQMKQEYWAPIWDQIVGEDLLFRSSHLPDDWVCRDDRVYLPVVLR